MHSPIILQAGCTIGKPAESEAAMEQLNALLGVLRQFPLWEEALAVDNWDGCPQNSSLQPLGLTVLSRREDLLGQVRWRLRQSYCLRRAAYPGAEAAAWVAGLQNWLLGRSTPELEAAFAPGLRLWAQQGRLVSTSQPGTGIYEIKIHVEYEKE